MQARYRHPLPYRARLFVIRWRARLSLLVRPARITGGQTIFNDYGSEYLRMDNADARRLQDATRRY